MATLVAGEKARMFALGKVARGGATRGGYVSGLVFITLGGVKVGTIRDGAGKVVIESLTITDSLNEIPNTCAFRVVGSVPPQGATIMITRGSQNSLTPLFAGFALTVEQLYLADNPANVAADVHCVDYTWQLGFVHVTGRFIGWSATSIIYYLVSQYGGANGFGTTNITPGLPTLNEITFTEEELTTAITRVCERIGAYWYVDYWKDVHVFFNDPTRQDVLLTTLHASLANVQRTGDRTQALSRVFVEGRGSRVIGEVLRGETAVPLDDVSMFEVASDLFAKVSFQGSDGGAQYLTFTEVVPSGGGALVGPGLAPSAPPTVTAGPGAGVDAGTHGYVYTWVTAAGETLASPPKSVQAGAVADPTTAPQNFSEYPPSGMYAYGSFITIGAVVQYGYAYSTAVKGASMTQTTAISPLTAPFTTHSNKDPLNPTQSAMVMFDVPYSTDPRVTEIFIYEVNSQTTASPRFTLRADNVPTAPAGTLRRFDTNGKGNVPASSNPPNPNTTMSGVISVTGIAVGPSQVTARKLYRTAANTASPLKLVTTIADNTTTSYTDTKADSALGATAPSTDTSALGQPTGTVLPGATLFPIAGASGFRTTGGWAVIGNGEQTIRYSTISGNTIQGIPASGVGSITAAIAFNSTITAAPMLLGVQIKGDPAIVTRGLSEGDELYLVVQRDNEQTRAALASSVGGNGIREEWVQDRRLSAAEARLRGDATLAIRPLDLYTLRYTCRDTRTAAGQTITVNLPAPTNLTGTYKAQTVTINNFRPYPAQQPTYSVEASSQQFSFDDWLRILKTVES